MASTRAILDAIKAAPAGRPTPAPQGASPYFGAISPVAQQLDTMNGYTYSDAYGSFLPRPPRTFTQGAFGPFSPILPVPVDTPEESGRARPRRVQEQSGWNLPVGEPGIEGLKLATFPTLRTLADLYSVARACIQLRKNEVRGLAWDIMPTPDAAKANKGNEKWFKDFGNRRAQALKFFQRPDPDYFTWNSFIDAFLEEVFVFDALSLYTRRKRGKGMRKGMLGSDLDCLELLSGPTIRPLYGIHGQYPRPPAPAYQQYLYGVPRSDFMQLVTDRDIDESDLKDSLWGQFSGDQLLYLPMVPRRWTPYGFPPVERALIPVMSGLQKQNFALDFFSQGTVPAVYMSPGDESMTPNQIRELQDALNGFAGDPAMHHKIIVLPPGTKVMPQRDAQLADQFDEIVMTQVCMAFDIMPMELGIAPKVSTTQSPGAANQMAKMTASKAERKSTKPLLMFISDIMNAILQDVCHQDDMRFIFEGLEEEEDQEQLTGLIVQQVSNGLRSIDEGRDLLGLQPWGLPETSGPIFTSPTTGPVPLVAAMQAATANAQAAENAATAGQVAALPPGQAGGEQAAPAGASAGEPGDAGTRALSTAEEANDTPGHAAAEEADDTAGRQGTRGSAGNAGGASGSKQPTTSGSGSTATSGNSGTSSGPAKQSDKMTVTVGLDRAVTAELEALARHLRKGRLISTWVPKNLPPRTLAVISEHVAKGLDPDQAVAVAKVTTLAGGATPKAAAAPTVTWGAWQHNRAVADAYRSRIAAAFAGAGTGVRALLGRYQSGALSVTRVVLESMIADVIGAALRPVLVDLWREAWLLGDRSATALANGLPPEWGAWRPGAPDTAHLGDSAAAFEQALVAHEATVLPEIAGTRVPELVAALGTLTGAAVADQMDALLDVDTRSSTIATNEINSLVGMSAASRYAALGVTQVVWLASANACTRICIPNVEQGPIALGELFQSGVAAPPGHVNCECALGPVNWAQKLLRRTVPLNGQETWVPGEPGEPNAAGGGGQSPVRHWGDGTQAPDGVPVTGGVPGSTAGGEPPRWDTPIANGYQGGLNDLSDRTNPAQGHHGSEGWRVPFNERPVAVDARGSGYPSQEVSHWPAGGHGTEQPPGGQVPGDANDRGAWAVGARKDGGVIAAGIAVYAADTGRVLLLQRAANPTTCTCGMPLAWGMDSGDWWSHADGSISHTDDDTSVSDRMGTDPPDPAAGYWEMPGGCREDGEAPHVAAKREWEEETGIPLPPGEFTGQWEAGNGKYHGYVFTVSRETDVPIHDGRDEVTNPDDPDGDRIESLAWWDPEHLVANPAVRPELAGDLDRVFDALGVTLDKSVATDMAVAVATAFGSGPAHEVIRQLSENFDPRGLGWVVATPWTGPQDVPLDEIDFDDEAAWAAHHQDDRVQHFVDKIQAGNPPHPAVLVRTPRGTGKLKVVDGHHRVLAYRHLDRPVPAYVGRVPRDTGPWDETHLYQEHQGDDVRNKRKP